MKLKLSPSDLDLGDLFRPRRKDHDDITKLLIQALLKEKKAKKKQEEEEEKKKKEKKSKLTPVQWAILLTVGAPFVGGIWALAFLSLLSAIQSSLKALIP